jgi:hypothetical protein
MLPSKLTSVAGQNPEVPKKYFSPLGQWDNGIAAVQEKGSPMNSKPRRFLLCHILQTLVKPGYGLMIDGLTLLFSGGFEEASTLCHMFLFSVLS